MVVKVEEEVSVTVIKQDLVWEVSDSVYTIKNVPTYVMDCEGKYFYDTEVTLKLTMLQEMMTNQKIPNPIDFTVVADLTL